MDGSVVWILATSGVGLKTALQKIRANCKDIDAVDVEEIILDQRVTMDTLQNLKISAKIGNMGDLASYLPRNKIRDLWQEAVKEAVHKLAVNENKVHTPIKIIAGHPLYYGRKRREFYSVLDAKVMRDALAHEGLPKMDHVAFLTDDIFDMYVRLRSKGQVFDLSEAPREYLKQTVADRDIRSLEKLTRFQLAELCSQWEFDVLRRLQVWRYLGTVIAENVSYQFDAHFLLWSVKQPIKALVDWFSGSQSIYLSHIISNLREGFLDTGKWAPIVQEVNSLPGHLEPLGITCTMPTGIDELRFQHEKGGTRRCTGLLTERWPIQGRVEDLLYAPLSDNEQADVTFSELLAPKFWNFSTGSLERLTEANGDKPKVGKRLERARARMKQRLSQLTEDLAEQVSFQLALRDHLLVSHADMLLVYRPFYGGRTAFTGGVEAEVNHWVDSAMTGGTRAAFVHFDEDVGRMLAIRLKSNQGESLKRGVEAVLTRVIKEQTKVGKEDAVNDLVRFTIQGERESSKLEGDRVDAGTRKIVAQNRPQNLETAESDTLRVLLTARYDLPPSAGVFVFEDFEHFRKESGLLSEFAKNGKPASNGWEKRIRSLFPQAVLAL